MRRSRPDSGSMLVMAMVVVAAAAALAVAAGIAVRARAAADGERLRARLGSRRAEAAAVQALMQRAAADTNSFDHLGEPWASEPWELREDGWVLRVSGTGWSAAPGGTAGLIDAERFASLNDSSGDFLREILSREAGIDPADAAAAADAVTAWRDQRRAAISNSFAAAAASGAAFTNPPPFSCVEELWLVPSMPEGAADALSRFATAAGSGRLNVNTADPSVVGCLLVSVDMGDIAAALRLRDRIAAFRDAGGVFASADPANLARSLGGIPPDETAVLNRAAELLCAASTAFSGVAEATSADDYRAGRAPFRHPFTWTRPPRQ